MSRAQIMDRVKYLIVGAGVSGLAFADRLPKDGSEYLICEASHEVGGYCRTITRDGFVWDYSGHFFHFKNPEIERELISRMGDQRVLRVERQSRIRWCDSLIDFPFQKNIHQLPKSDFIDCLVDLYFRPEGEPENFRDMLYAKFGKSIAEKFLVPYNEKLYATDLVHLDVNAMGRFFPHADVADIIRNFREPDNKGYNSTFTYPEGGAIQYVRALLHGVDERSVSLGERVESIDLSAKTARTSRRELAFEHLINTGPFNQLLELAGVAHDPSIFSWNQVLVFNMGFDRRGLDGVHWIYFPQRELSFYRVGFYDNIFGSDRMSLYVEIGLPKDAEIGPSKVEELRQQVMWDLRAVDIVEDHELIAWHSVVMDPAYVHITQDSLREVERLKSGLAKEGVHSIGRYGSWTYCSIEDNMIEARALVDALEPRS